MVRAYESRPVDPAVLERVLDAAMRAPYWWVDGGAAVQNLLLAAHGEGLGASFFGLFVNEHELLEEFGVPDGRRALGALTLGHPLAEPRVRSTPRARRTLDEVVHTDRW